jgi:hypothetical protein
MKTFLLAVAALAGALLVITLPAPAPLEAGSPAVAAAAPARPAPAVVRTAAARSTAAPAPAARPEAVAAVMPAPAPAAFAVPGLRPEVLERALAAARCADSRGLVRRPELLTVIDYSLPSSEKRLWVLDLENREVLFHELTSHGKASGNLRTTSFSNVSMSLMSNLGLMTTAETYYGKNGYSLRLDGHEPGYNDLARERAIVVHGAPYVSPDFVRQTGRLGRSWGCPAVEQGVARELIDTIQGGSVIFGYYPDQEWLESSRLLSCAPAGGRTVVAAAP